MQNAFFEGTQKNVRAMLFGGLFVHVQRWAVQIKTMLAAYMQSRQM